MLCSAARKVVFLRNFERVFRGTRVALFPVLSLVTYQTPQSLSTLMHVPVGMPSKLKTQTTSTILCVFGILLGVFCSIMGTFGDIAWDHSSKMLFVRDDEWVSIARPC